MLPGLSSQEDASPSSFRRTSLRRRRRRIDHARLSPSRTEEYIRRRRRWRRRLSNGRATSNRSHLSLRRRGGRGTRREEETNANANRTRLEQSKSPQKNRGESVLRVQDEGASSFTSSALSLSRLNLSLSICAPVGVLGLNDLAPPISKNGLSSFPLRRTTGGVRDPNDPMAHFAARARLEVDDDGLPKIGEREGPGMHPGGKSFSSFLAPMDDHWWES